MTEALPRPFATDAPDAQDAAVCVLGGADVNKVTLITPEAAHGKGAGV